MISEGYIMKLLSAYAESKPGKDAIKQWQRDRFENGSSGSGYLTRSQANADLADIAAKLYNAITAVIPSFARSFDSIHISSPAHNGKNGYEAAISIDEDALRRESLHYMNKREYERSGNLRIGAGSGVYDIVGLFTHGYEIRRKRPYGFWVHEGGDSEERIGARMQRDPDPFLRELTDRLNSEYAGVCEITLNDNYIH